MNKNTLLDLPGEKSKPLPSTPSDGFITALILENDKYTFEDDDKQYDWEEYKIEPGKKLTESESQIRDVKIAGHRMAHYEAVFRVLAFCQANELEPILAYDK